MNPRSASARGLQRIFTFDESQSPQPSRAIYSLKSRDSPMSGDLEISRVIHITWRFPTQFQSRWTQPLSSFLSNDTTHTAVSGIKDMLEPLIQKSSSLRDTTIYNDVGFWIHVFCKEFSNQFGTVWRDFRWLDEGRKREK